MTEFATLTIEEPIDLVKLCINEYVYIKLRHERELKGKLHVLFNYDLKIKGTIFRPLIHI